MLEVDVTEEAKQVALYRYELTGELYDDDEILNFFYNDITELEQEERDEITVESWLEEMISFTKSDDTLTGSARQRWPKCGTGQSDRAMSGSRWAGAVRRPRSLLAPKSPIGEPIVAFAVHPCPPASPVQSVIVRAVTPDHAEGLRYHVVPADDPLRARFAA